MESSILSFKDRGPWGDSRYPGNCSGRVYRDLLGSLRPRLFVDPMMGSGTSVEVARELGIEAIGLDLRLGFDALTMSILEKVGRHADCVVSHPPYFDMILYQQHQSDLSQSESAEDFHQKLQRVLLNQRDATSGGGVYGALIGDYRRGGQYISSQAEMIARMPKSELASVIIKVQHNCMSDRKRYGRMRFPPIRHEYLVLWEKSRVVMSALCTLAAIAKQQSEQLRGTWKAMVQTVLCSLGGKASLAAIYERMAKDAPDRIAGSQHWRAKVRQVVQLHAEFRQVERGVWALS